MNLMHKQQKEPCNASNDIWYTRKMYKNMRNIKNTQIILVSIGPDYFLIKRYKNMDEFHTYNLKCLFSRDNQNLKTIKQTFVNDQSNFDL